MTDSKIGYIIFLRRVDIKRGDDCFLDQPYTLEKCASYNERRYKMSNNLPDFPDGVIPYYFYEVIDRKFTGIYRTLKEIKRIYKLVNL